MTRTQVAAIIEIISRRHGNESVESASVAAACHPARLAPEWIMELVPNASSEARHAGYEEYDGNSH
jgi:hypothetical protein